VSGTLTIPDDVAELVGSVQIDLDVFTQEPGSEAGRSFQGKLKLGLGGDFSFQAPRNVGLLELEAYMDVDGDGPTPGDPFGACTSNPVQVASSDIEGLEIALAITQVQTDDD
jgi:hypothetical protein